MSHCSIAIYGDQGVNLRVEIESTCEKLYTCSNADTIRSVQGASVAPFRGCYIIENKGSSVKISMRFPRVEGVIPDNPVKGNLIHPYPPYTPAEILIVLDTSPYYDLYGLEIRGATVITSRKRVVLEGRGIVQLVDASQGTVLSDAEIVVDDVLAFESLYPVLPRDKHSRGIRLCSKKLGIMEEGLNYDHGNPTYILGYVDYLRKHYNRMTRLQVQAALTKTYSLLPTSTKNVTRLAERLSSLSRIEAVLNQNGRLKLVPGLEGLPLRLRRKEQDRTVIVETLLDPGKEIPANEWHEISVFCRECWEPLSLYELRNTAR